MLECVRKGINSDGFQLFSSSAHSALGESHEAYRIYLQCLFDELSIDLGILFDRFSSLALLFPRKESLDAILKELNGTGAAAEREQITSEEFAEIWKADETIGWIYQYYNDEAERKKMREESAAPRNSRELAVRNQFFTPRYVVEFLTDNTLGRIWYEMTRGETCLKDHCRYLVRRPSEIFLKSGEEPPEQAQQESLSQEELLKQTVHIPYRQLKDPRTILMLDPACGSMHFGLYAFDLFEVIYDEAWMLEEKLGVDALSRPPGMKSLHDTYAGKDAFLKDVPRLIIENNLHGIDIDPRCAQIAGLSLWLRAQKAWQRLGLAPAQRPAIKRSNIVCAEPMPGEKELLREFVEREFPAVERTVCLRLLEAIFDKMQLAGEAGSLLKIEEEIRSAIEDAKKQWKAGPQMEQSQLFGGDKLKQQDIRLDYSGLTESEFWDQLEENIYAALRDYSEQAENGGGFQRRLFAEDAARGFAFIDVCLKRYEAVVMNPPFGEASGDAFDYIAAQYPDWNKNILCAFFSRAAGLLTDGGAVGAIYDRTILVKSSYEDFRRADLLSRLSISCLADLGWEVLDANVEVSAHVLRSEPHGHRLFFDVRRSSKSSKGDDLLAKIVGSSTKDLWCANPSDFANLPNSVIGYDFKPYMLRAFSRVESIKQRGFQAFTGSQLPKDPYFRLWWETSQKAPKPFVRNIFKGGSFAAYVCSLRDVFISDVPFSELPTGTSTKIYNLEHYGQPGVAWGERGDWLCAYILPKDCCFALEGPTVPVPNEAERLALLGFLNTPVAREMINRICGQHKTSGYVNLLPYAPLEDVGAVALQVKSVVSALLLARRFDETQLLFARLKTDSSVKEFAMLVKCQIESALEICKRVQSHLHKVCSAQLGLSRDEVTDLDRLDEALPVESLPIEDADYNDGCEWFAAYSVVSCGLGIIFGRWDIRYATGEQAAPELPDPFAPLPVCPPGQLQNAQGLPLGKDEVGRMKEEGLWNYPIEIPWDGILMDDPNHPLDIERRVREVIEIIWSGKDGGPTAEAIEHEACEILGVKSLRDYFRKPAGFFADHLKRYSKSRRQAPIYWPLSTASGSYTLWIYYHRLSPDTLYKCLQQFVNPKIVEIEKELAHLRSVIAAGDGSTKERKQLDEQESLRREIIELRDELEIWAPKWKPNLNDGVLITAAPLWKLFRLPKWQKELKACWQDLEKGDYDWAHLAYSLWPERVREKCKTDRSIAIAHGLEELCEVKPPDPKTKKGRKKKDAPEEQIEAEL